MKKTKLEKTTSREEGTSQLIENIHVSKYISIAESSTVNFGELADICVSEVNRNDSDCVSDYEDAIDGILLNTYKALVADGVEKNLKVSFGFEMVTAAIESSIRTAEMQRNLHS